MKLERLLTALLLILFTYSLSYSQKLVKEGHQWNVVHESFWAPGTSTELTKILGDTIINDTIFNKLYSTRDTLDTNWALRNELLREDSLGRVYMREIDSGQEHLLFDFSLQPNDTFSIYLGRYSNPNFECLAIVSHFDSVRINNGDKRKRIHFKMGWDNLSPGPVWVEGIGSTVGGLFGDVWYCVTDIILGLNCFYDNDEILFPESPAACFIDIPVSVNNTLPTDINIYPNPISETLHITSGTTKIKFYKIMDLMGREILSNEYTEEIIDVSKIPVGTYLILLETKSGSKYSEKLIKLE